MLVLQSKTSIVVVVPLHATDRHAAPCIRSLWWAVRAHFELGPGETFDVSFGEVVCELTASEGSPVTTTTVEPPVATTVRGGELAGTGGTRRATLPLAVALVGLGAVAAAAVRTARARACRL